MTLRPREQDRDWREIEADIVVLDGRDAVSPISGAGSLTWKVLAGHADRETLIQARVETYGVDRWRTDDDVDTYLTALAGQGLLAT
jgi:hypothetical protein